LTALIDLDLFWKITAKV